LVKGEFWAHAPILKTDKIKMVDILFML